MAIWSWCIACWIPKATNTPSECVIFIAFALQQWLQERVSVLRNTCITCVRKLEGSLRSANGDAGRIFSLCEVGSHSVKPGVIGLRLKQKTCYLVEVSKFGGP